MYVVKVVNEELYLGKKRVYLNREFVNSLERAEVFLKQESATTAMKSKNTQWQYKQATTKAYGIEVREVIIKLK